MLYCSFSVWAYGLLLGCLAGRMLVCYRPVLSESDELHFLSVWAFYMSLGHTPTRLWRWVKHPHIHTYSIHIILAALNYIYIYNHTRISFPCILFGPVLLEHHLEADEGEGVVLDCFLPWHTLVVGQTEYHYSWLPAKNVHVTQTQTHFSVLQNIAFLGGLYIQYKVYEEFICINHVFIGH